jgi:hypothetical protein
MSRKSNYHEAVDRVLPILPKAGRRRESDTKIAPADQPEEMVMADGTTIELYLTQIRDEMRKGFSELNRGIADLRGHFARAHRRKDLTEPTRRRHLAALRRMGGMCPCCREVRIINESGAKLPGLQFDHWKGPACNGVESTWPVCEACNGRLEDPLFKGRKQNSFASYQDFLLGPDGRFVQGDLFKAA